MYSEVAMADLISCWKKNTGQSDGTVILPEDKSQEFFAYSLKNLDKMMEQISKKGVLDYIDGLEESQD